MNRQSQIAIAVSTDELVDFLMKCSSSTRMLIRDMSLGAVREFKLQSSARGDVCYLFFQGIWEPENDSSAAEIIRWTHELAHRQKMIYLVRTGPEPEDFEEIRTDKHGSLGIELRKSFYFRAA